jgi:hypothetical protein
MSIFVLKPRKEIRRKTRFRAYFQKMTNTQDLETFLVPLHIQDEEGELALPVNTALLGLDLATGVSPSRV